MRLGHAEKVRDVSGNISGRPPASFRSVSVRTKISLPTNCPPSSSGRNWTHGKENESYPRNHNSWVVELSDHWIVSVKEVIVYFSDKSLLSILFVTIHLTLGVPLIQ